MPSQVKEGVGWPLGDTCTLMAMPGNPPIGRSSVTDWILVCFAWKKELKVVSSTDCVDM